ncbi:16S rRNA (cytosine(1402)-N(4))-methyltransferase RsmH [bacterium]|nr:16S rRNA (cytosine(1402)-N(4))-methyltransferase RsmH [bacterium]
MADLLADILLETGGTIFLDVTIGNAGYFKKMLNLSQRDFHFYGIDLDEEALKRAKRNLRYSNLSLKCANNLNLSHIAKEWGVEKFDGICGDFGLSWDQLLDSSRGFSYKSTGALDMRFSIEQDTNAADLVNNLPKDELIGIFKDIGQERFSRRIANEIISLRPLETCDQLTDIVRKIYRGKSVEKCLSRIYMSLRVTVNKELEAIDQLLPAALDLLSKGGRFVFLSYNSNEDRRVKNFFQHWSKACRCKPESPVCTCDRTPRLKILTKKAITPSKKEIINNPMSRAAKLRAAQKL